MMDIVAVPLSTNQLQLVNYGVSVAYQLSEGFSVGLGISYQDGRFKSQADLFFPTEENLPEGFFGPSSYETGSRLITTQLTTDDWDWTFNLGFLWHVSRQWSVGGFFRQGPDWRVLGFDARGRCFASPLMLLRKQVCSKRRQRTNIKSEKFMSLEIKAIRGLRLLGFILLFATVGWIAARQLTKVPELRTAPEDQVREVRVVTSGGFTAAFDLLESRAEEVLGIELHTEHGASSGGAPNSIPVRLERGEQFDVIILSRSSLDRLTARGDVRPDSRVDLVRSIIGMAVRSGAPKPDISSPEAFVQTLMNAESIGYSASASGTYLSTVLWPKMGIWERLKPKSKRILGERVGYVVARGEVEIGFQQISEILPIEGADFVGPIPDRFQKVTTFSAGILKRAENPEDAERLLGFLSSMSVAQTIESTGLVPVVLEKQDTRSPVGFFDRGVESIVAGTLQTDSSITAITFEFDGYRSGAGVP